MRQKVVDFGGSHRKLKEPAKGRSRNSQCRSSAAGEELLSIKLKNNYGRERYDQYVEK